MSCPEEFIMCVDAGDLSWLVLLALVFVLLGAIMSL